MTRRPVRLLVDATPLAADALTGVGRVLLETLRALEEERFHDRASIVLVVPWSESRALRRWGLRSRVHRIPLPRRVVGAMTRLPLPLDLLVGRGVYFFPNYRNWPLTARSSGITFVHDACFAVLPSLVPAARRALLTARMPGWLSRSSLVATGTPSAAREINEHLGVAADRIRVLPTTVDADVFRPRPPGEVASVTASLEVTDYLLFVGAIEPRKNLAALVRAYAAADRPPGHTLLLVGAASWEDEAVRREMRTAVSAGADVRFAARFVADDELPALMTGADALALVSLHEGFGLPALEAVASGTPVIASDIPGIRDALRGHESAAGFVDPRDHDALVRAIEAAIRRPRRIEPGTIRPWTDAAEALVAAAEELAS